MTPTLLMLDDETVRYLRQALVLMRGWCRTNAVPTPAQVRALEAALSSGTVRNRPEPSPLDKASGPADGAAMNRTRSLLHSLDDVAEMLDISRSTVERMCGDGRLTSRKVGRRRLVHRDDVDAYLDRQSDPGAA